MLLVQKMWNIEYMREKAARQLSSREDMNNMQNCRVVCLQLTRSADLSLGGGGQLEAAKQLSGYAARHNTLLPRWEKLSEALMRVIQYA